MCYSLRLPFQRPAGVRWSVPSFLLIEADLWLLLSKHGI